MSESIVEIRPMGGGDCVVRHAPSGAEMHTSRSPVYGGRGSSFSSTDLLAAALGSCIATDLEPVAERHGVTPESIIVRVTKALTVRPKKLRSLEVEVEVSGTVADGVLVRLERAAQHCLVHRSLHGDIDVRITIRRLPLAVEPESKTPPSNRWREAGESR